MENENKILSKPMFPEAEKSYWSHRYAACDGEVELPVETVALIEAALDVRDDMKVAQDDAERLKRKHDAILNGLFPYFKGKTRGHVSDGDTEYIVTCRESRKHPTIDFNSFEKENPEIYAELVEEKTIKVLDPDKRFKYDRVVRKHTVPGQETGERIWRIKVI